MPTMIVVAAATNREIQIVARKICIAHKQTHTHTQTHRHTCTRYALASSPLPAARWRAAPLVPPSIGARPHKNQHFLR